MDKFRTIVKIPDSKIRINYSTKSMFIGSCFSENIGTKLSQLKFQTIINPFGVLYNPISIANSINLLINKKNELEN